MRNKKKMNESFRKGEVRESEIVEYKDMFDKDLRSTGPTDFDKLDTETLRYHQWCLDNYKYCLSRIGDYIKGKFKFDVEANFGLRPEFNMSMISADNRGAKRDSQKYPMPFSRETYEYMLSCAKFKLCPTIFKRLKKDELFEDFDKDNDDVFASYTNWYVGRVGKQLVLFKEVTSYPIEGDFFDKTGSKYGFPNSGGSYELKAMIAGNNNLMCELVRLDHKPTSGHCNNIKDGKFIRQEPKVLHGTHCHCANEKFNVVYPHAFTHSEALQVNQRANSLTFGQCIMAVKQASNIRDGYDPVFASEYSKNSVVNNYETIPEDKAGSNFEQRLWRSIEMHKGAVYDITEGLTADIAASGYGMEEIHDRISNVQSSHSKQ